MYDLQSLKEKNERLKDRVRDGVSVVSRETQWHCDLVGGLSVKRSGFQTRVDHCVVFLGLRLYPHTCCESTVK